MIRKGLWSAIILAIVIVGIAGVRAQMAARAHPTDNGQAGPRFTLPSQYGSQVSMAKYTGKWVVIFVYSKRKLNIILPDYLLQVRDGDATSLNTIEARSFQRDLPKYAALNTVVLGLSPDSVEEHKAFCTKESLTFPLLTVNAQALDGLGVPRSGIGEDTTVERDTFLISPTGNIAKVWWVKDVQSHSEEVLATIAAAQQPGYIFESLRESSI